MALKLNSVRSLLVKLLAYIALFYLLVVVIVVSITGYIFLNLDSYRVRIEQTVFNRTGYKLTIDSITTKLDHNYLPELIIKKAKLVNPNNQQQFIDINRIDLILSYASIIHFKPLFHEINIDGSSLTVEYNADGSIFINSLKAYDPADLTLENIKAPFDFEGWLLLQDSVKLSNINLNYIDHKNNIPKINLKQVEGGIKKDFWGNRTVYLDIFGKNSTNYLEAKLNWRGNKFEDWLYWKYANFKLSAVSLKANKNGSLLINNLLANLKSSIS